jgi:hypothetical protein
MGLCGFEWYDHLAIMNCEGPVCEWLRRNWRNSRKIVCKGRGNPRKTSARMSDLLFRDLNPGSLKYEEIAPNTRPLYSVVSPNSVGCLTTQCSATWRRKQTTTFRTEMHTFQTRSRTVYVPAFVRNFQYQITMITVYKRILILTYKFPYQLNFGIICIRKTVCNSFHL